MQETILIIYLVIAIALVGIILVQQGKGAEMGASFGAGGANTVFGAAGSGNALTKATTILAVLFFGIALSISYLNSSPEVVVDEVFEEQPATEKTNIEDALPTDDSVSGGKDSLESELPPAEAAPAAIDTANEAVRTAQETAGDKVEDSSESQAAEASDKPAETGDNN